MALADYILCTNCKLKLIYHGNNYDVIQDGCGPLYCKDCFKEELRDAWEDSHATFEDRTNLSFESYWQQKFGGGE